MKNKNKQNSLLNIPIDPLSRKEVLEKIIKYIKTSRNFLHIVSLNPEILVEATKNPQFKKVVKSAQIRIVDGSGVILASKLIGIQIGERYTGIKLMEDLLKEASHQRLRVMLLGGRPKIAEQIVACQKQAQSKATFFATDGIKDIQNPTAREEKGILFIVADYRPHILLVSFGSPFSELWLYEHRQSLKKIVCASVGGAFDYMAGTTPRAPQFIHQIGLEWLYRLVTQPWRWRRQLKLITFTKEIFKEMIKYR